MSNLLNVEVGHLTGSGEGFLSPDALEEIAAKGNFSSTFDRFISELKRDDLPLGAPFRNRDLVQQVKSVADSIKGKYKDFVVLGIGGSTLGARAVLQALRGPFYNVFTNDGPRTFVFDNIDPFVTDALLNNLDIARTHITYISKSGSTPEPAATFMVFLHAFRQAGGNVKDIVIICDKKKNGINEIAAELGCHLLHIPDDQGGRYSVLSPVGLVPAELSGIDTTDLMQGAEECRKKLISTPANENPCYMLGRAFQAYARKGRSIHFLFTYSNLLSEFNLWFLQLWSESLGKRLDLNQKEVRAGEMPTVGIGATDQHSVLQLLKEGPLDKVVGFLKIENSSKDVTIPKELAKYVEYAYLTDHTVAEQLEIERLSTEIALYTSGTPCYTVSVSKLDAASLGALFYFWEAVVVYMAALKNIDPFNQPGVQSGKDMTYALMGRKDYADRQKEQKETVEDYTKQSRLLTL